MWSYWKDKRGSPSEALEADYPNLLKSSSELQAALYQIKMCQARIDAIMSERETQYYYDDLSGILGRPFGSCGG